MSVLNGQEYPIKNGKVIMKYDVLTGEGFKVVNEVIVSESNMENNMVIIHDGGEKIIKS